MKKWLYLIGAFLLGVVAASSGQAVAFQVKSLIGQKVTGEYTVIVNGTKLQEKGAVIDGKTNAPVRALSDAIGADLNLDNTSKTIEITTNDGVPGDKSLLLEKKEKLEREIQTIVKEREETQAKYNNQSVDPNTGKREAWMAFESLLKSYDNSLVAKRKELDEVNEALKAFE